MKMEPAGKSAPATAKRPYVMRARAVAAEETAQRIIDAAYRRILAEHYDDITLSQIAADSAVTVQTVLRRFGSKEGVLAAVFEATTAAVESSRNETTPGNVDDVVDTVVAQYEHDGDAVIRLLGLEQRVEVVGRQMDRGREQHRRWLSEMLADQLSHCGGDPPMALAKAIVATDVYTWKVCRRDLDLTVERTRQIMGDLLRAALYTNTETST